MSLGLLHRVLFVPSLQKSLYSLNRVKSIGKCALINDSVIQVVRRLDTSVRIKSFKSGNDFVLDLVPSEYASLADDMHYDFWNTVLGHQFKTEMNQ
jgi:hypothetical protein